MKWGRVMSDMYLTKVERKTIFTQGLIYVLFTFIISDLTVVGPHWFIVFPWLFILGILGVNKFYHPVLTVVLSTITTAMASLFKYNLSVETLTSTLIATSVVSCGIIVGLCIKDFVLDQRLVKHLSTKKKITNIVVMVVLTISTVVAYSCRYGNIISYAKSRSDVNKYLDKAGIEDYTVEKYQYISGSFNEYVYKLNVLDGKITLKTGKDITITNFDEWKEHMNQKLKIDSNVFKEDFKASLSYEFSNVTVVPDGIIATITVSNLDVNDEQEIQGFIQALQEVLSYKDKLGIGVKRCILGVNKGVETLNSSEFKNINSDYIKRIIMVEEQEIN